MNCFFLRSPINFKAKRKKAGFAMRFLQLYANEIIKERHFYPGFTFLRQPNNFPRYQAAIEQKTNLKLAMNFYWCNKSVPNREFGIYVNNNN